jgi:hypothetical protein
LAAGWRRRTTLGLAGRGTIFWFFAEGDGLTPGSAGRGTTLKLLAGGGSTTLWSLAGVEGLHFGYWLEENFFTLLRNWKMKEYTMYGVQLKEEGTWAL